MSREHGTRACYAAGCRLPECRKANRTYENDRARKRLYGIEANLVDAAPVREHLNALRVAGVGTRAIAHASGMGRSAILEICKGITHRVRPETAERLCSLTVEVRAGGGLVGAGPTWELIRCMRKAGIPKSRIALALGRTSPALQLNHKTVTERNAAAVRDLHERAWLGTPALRDVCVHFGRDPQLERDRINAQRSRRQRADV